MTAKRDLKRRVRQRQARTGEAYVTARRHVLAARSDGAAGDPADGPNDDLDDDLADDLADDDPDDDLDGPGDAVTAAPDRAARDDAGAATSVDEAAVADPAGSSPTAVSVVELIDLSDEARRIGLLCRVKMFPSLAARVEPATVLTRLRDLLLGMAGDPAFLLLSDLALTGRARRHPQQLRNFARLQQFVRRARAGVGGLSDDGSILAFHVAVADHIVPTLCSVSWRDASLTLMSIDDSLVEAWGPLMTRLTVLSSALPTLFAIHDGRRYPVKQDRFLIGRDRQTVHLVIEGSTVSGRHAEVIRRDGVYYVKDLESTHGIVYKGMRIDNKRIDEGDVFQIGDHALRFTFLTADET